MPGPRSGKTLVPVWYLGETKRYRLVLYVPTNLVRIDCMGHIDLNSPISLVLITNLFIGLSLWFVKRYIAQNDTDHQAIAKTLQKIRDNSVHLEKLTSNLSKEVEVRLERLDTKSLQWTEKLTALEAQSTSLTMNLYKIESRIEVINEKLSVLNQNIDKTDLVLSKLSENISSLSIAHLKAELDQTGKVVQAVVQKLKEVETDLRTVKVALGPNVTLITSKKP